MLQTNVFLLQNNYRQRCLKTPSADISSPHLYNLHVRSKTLWSFVIYRQVFHDLAKITQNFLVIQHSMNSQICRHLRGVLKTQSKIYDGAFLRK